MTKLRGVNSVLILTTACLAIGCGDRQGKGRRVTAPRTSAEPATLDAEPDAVPGKRKKEPGILDLNDGVGTLDEFLTNHPDTQVHDGPATILVTLNDGTTLQGQLVDHEPVTDDIKLKLASGEVRALPKSSYKSFRFVD